MRSDRTSELVPAVIPSASPLSAAQYRILEAAASRILPSGDGPGAAETGVARYIAQAILDPWHRHFRPLFERGLEFFDALAMNAQGRSFTSCTEDQQDEILRAAQEFPNNDSRRFFDMLVHLVLEGFLCHPSQGGNQEELGWKFFRSELVGSGYCAGGPAADPSEKVPQWMSKT